MSTTPSAPYDPSEESPNEVFKRMAVCDEKQNQNLARKYSKKSASYKLNTDQATVSVKPAKVTSMRFLVCLIGVLSLAVSQMNRMVINICITKMIDPTMLAEKSSDSNISSDDSCPWPMNNLQELTTQSPTTSELVQTTYTDSTSVILDPFLFYLTKTGYNTTTSSKDYEDLQTIIRESIDATEATNIDALIPSLQETEDKFMWDMKDQSYLLGGFFWSYSLFMILGGWIAENYGAKYILLLGVLGSSIISLASPLIARCSLTLLVCSRVLMGVFQAGVFPAMYAVISKWLTMSEASIFAPMIKMNLRLGMFAASAIPSVIPDWPGIFYFAGATGVIWSILWIILATSDPKDNSWVSKGELEHILKKKRKQPLEENLEEAVKMTKLGNKAELPKKQQEKIKIKTPWMKIITNPSVIGLLIVKFTFNTGADFLSIELPSYLNYVHHIPIKKISWITSSIFAIQVTLIVSVGWLAKVVVKKRPFNISKTAIRKSFQCLSNYGVGLCLILLTFNDCNIIYVIVVLELFSLFSMFAAGGETMLPYDLSDQFPATIMAIANSAGNLSGIAVTSIAGLILGNQGGSYERWNSFMFLLGCLNIIGGLIFMLIVKAEPIDFESETKQNSQKTTKNINTSNGTSRDEKNPEPSLQNSKEKPHPIEDL